MIDIHNDTNWNQWADLLSEQDYLVLDDFITDEEVAAYRSELRRQLENDAFSKAGIGTMGQYQVKDEIRGDYIKWLNPQQDEVVKPFFDRIDVIIENLNRLCFLSLSGAEFHFAHYPQGTCYKRHLDQFQQSNNRLISVIMYLNAGWQEGDGGELKVFVQEKEDVIQPLSKRLVLMKSHQVEHEVLMTYKDRYSITGWLLHKPVGLGFL